MAPSSKGKVATDHVKAFNVAATEFKSKASEKSLVEIDKILAVLSKISDAAVFSPSKPEAFQLLMNCQYLLSYLDYKSNTVWAVVGLLTTLCQDPAVTRLLRTRLELLPVCAKLLHSIPTTTQARTLKLLQLLKLLVDGIIITRREAYLTSLLSDLSSFLSDNTPDLSSLSLFILCCLSKDNYISTKLLLSTLSTQALQGIFSTPNTSSDDQLTAEILCYFMTKVKLSPNPPSPAKVKGYLPKLVDVFSTSYASDDIPLMSLLTSFLASLSSDSEYRSILAQQECLPHLHQLLVMADFSEGFSLTASSQFFSFLKTVLTSYSTDYVVVFDNVLKVVLARLDVKPYNKVSSALILVKTFLQNMDFDSMPDATARNLKFQVDQLLPCLMTTFLDSKSGSKLTSRTKLEQVVPLDLEGEALASCMECLQLLEVIAGVPLKGWKKAVGEIIKATKMGNAFRGYIDLVNDVVLKAKLATEFITLASILGEEENSWNKVVLELIGDKDKINLVAEVLRQESMEGVVMKKALVILNKTESPEMLFESTKEDESVGGYVEDNAVVPEQLNKIDSLLESVTDALERLEVEHVVGEVMQLATIRRGQEKQQLASMMEALTAADTRIAAQNRALVEREEQVQVHEKMTMDLVVRLGACKEELTDIRAQHGDLSREADCTRDKLGKELNETREQLNQVKGDNAVLGEKYARCKEKVEKLTEDLKLYKDNQEQLETKLRQEMRAKEEVTVALSKREDKLKKKEKQLDEELTAREKAEKENEELRKKCSTLENLSKNQEKALNKKEKLLQESMEEVKQMRQVQDAIFNLSKTRGSNSAGSC